MSKTIEGLYEKERRVRGWRLTLDTIPEGKEAETLEWLVSWERKIHERLEESWEELSAYGTTSLGRFPPGEL